MKVPKGSSDAARSTNQQPERELWVAMQQAVPSDINEVPQYKTTSQSKLQRLKEDYSNSSQRSLSGFGRRL